MSDWKDVIFLYYQVLQTAVEIAKGLSKIKKAFQKEYTVKEIKENLSSGELHFGDKIKIMGTFSEYLPFVDPKFFLTRTEIQPPLPRTARLQAINDVYCGALFKPEQKNAFASEVLPLFYGIESKVLEHYTGEMLELNCQIIQVPEQYRSIMNQNSYFTFQKEEGLEIPFGLKVLNVEPYGIVDAFNVNAWLIGNLNPAPRLKLKKKEEQHGCGSCGHYFSYMQIEPMDFPLEYGCTVCAPHAPKELVESSKKFFELEKTNKPYIVFPEIFKQFEVFYPSINLFDEVQKKHSTNIILGVVEENMEELFQTCPVSDYVVVPKESALSIDFQYDQLNKITAQTFDSSTLPELKCRDYVPDPEKIKKFGNEDVESVNTFRLKKGY